MRRIRETSLHQAAIKGYMESVHALIEAGTDVHERNIRDETPLDWARSQEWAIWT